MSDASGEIVHRVKAALDQIRYPVKRPLVIGLSGGMDSQVVVHALRAAIADAGPELRAVHVDHGLRPSSSNDADQVAARCDTWGIPCEIVRVDVSSWDAILKQGTESAARHARYAALANAAIDAGSDTIVTGHTLDDQVETVLLKLISGTGLEGVSAMSQLSRRPIPLSPGSKAVRRLALFRPLLSISREQVEQYAAEHEIVPIEDETNLLTIYRRNEIRQTVVPALAAVEPTFKEAIARTTNLLRDDARFIADVVDETFDEVTAERAGVWMLERQQFRAAYPAIQRRILYRVIEPLLSPNARLSGERVEALRQAAIDGQPGKIIELADDLIGYVDYDRLAIGRSATLESELRRLSWVPLMEPGTEIVLNGSIDVALQNGWRVIGNIDTEDVVTLRTRRDGDRTRSARGRSIKLQDWLVDRRVPRYLRDWLPLVEIDEEIHWIIGFEMTEFSTSRNDLNLRLELDAPARPSDTQGED